MSASLKTNRTAAMTKGAVGVELQLVRFDVAGEQYAVNILSVQEINRMTELTRVPNSAPDVAGLINLRGQIIPVVDLRTTFNMPQAATSESSRIVVVEIHSKKVGLIVDRVHEVLRIDQSIVEPPPAMVRPLRSEFIDGVGKVDDRLIILLNLSKLFPESSLNTLSNAA